MTPPRIDESHEEKGTRMNDEYLADDALCKSDVAVVPPKKKRKIAFSFFTYLQRVPFQAPSVKNKRFPLPAQKMEGLVMLAYQMGIL